jgi:enterobactin synthetase component D
MINLIEKTPHGVLVVRSIEGARDELVSRLHPEEAALTQTWGDPRAITFAAGRGALREALAKLGMDVNGPILRSARGAPILPVEGVVASVSHKDRVAAAIASFENAFIGVDVEDLEAKRNDVSEYVLTERELAIVKGSQRDMLIRFSLKEALYKAIDPTVQRYVGFHEVEVDPSDDGTAEFMLNLKKREGPFDVEGRWRIVENTVVTTVKVTAW